MSCAAQSKKYCPFRLLQVLCYVIINQIYFTQVRIIGQYQTFFFRILISISLVSKNFQVITDSFKRYLVSEKAGCNQHQAGRLYEVDVTS